MKTLALKGCCWAKDPRKALYLLKGGLSKGAAKQGDEHSSGAGFADENPKEPGEVSCSAGAGQECQAY
jgi:hypothetical protein